MAKKGKLKTHKSTAKRFKMTGTGKLLRTKGGKSHLRRRKAARTKNKFNKLVGVAASEVKRVTALAPYLRRYKSNPPS